MGQCDWTEARVVLVGVRLLIARTGVDSGTKGGRGGSGRIARGERSARRTILLDDRFQLIKHVLERRLGALLLSERDQGVMTSRGVGRRSGELDLESDTLGAGKIALSVSNFLQAALEPSHAVDFHHGDSYAKVGQSLSGAFSSVGHVVHREQGAGRRLEREEVVEPTPLWRRSNTAHGGSRRECRCAGARSSKVPGVWHGVDGH